MNMILIAMIVLGLTGFAFALLLAILSKKLHVEQDSRIEQVNKILPGLNCGACGFSGCLAFAQAVIKERKIFNGCLPAGEELNKEIVAIIGAGETRSGKKKITAICVCGADCKEKLKTSIYLGPQTCQAAHITAGSISCNYGCLGFGDCIKVCPTEAIRLEKEKIYIEHEKCIGCAKCIKACPRKVLKITALTDLGTYYIACSNITTALETKAVCTRGCIGCTLCTRVQNSPYIMNGNLACVNASKVSDEVPLEAAKQKCPTQCIANV
ncbi:MAG: RnfABCDGE type electron transport complex subunit B [Candidatus Omnitrophica bacterium]|nr:RnfABCDGE type electron transport complex subunit B [Candidatus Omnitrophota bacterium]